jgi:hypothetical protein
MYIYIYIYIYGRLEIKGKTIKYDAGYSERYKIRV